MNKQILLKKLNEIRYLLDQVVHFHDRASLHDGYDKLELLIEEIENGDDLTELLKHVKDQSSKFTVTAALQNYNLGYESYQKRLEFTLNHFEKHSSLVKIEALREKLGLEKEGDKDK